MKLRNKRTGDIVELKIIQVDNVNHEVNFLNGEKLTLKLLINSFYDVKESPIKDEKVLKVVRAWAEVNELEPDFEVRYSKNSYALISWQANIEFNKHIDGLEDDKKYTITELCGED